MTYDSQLIEEKATAVLAEMGKTEKEALIPWAETCMAFADFYTACPAPNIPILLISSQSVILFSYMIRNWQGKSTHLYLYGAGFIGSYSMDAGY